MAAFALVFECLASNERRPGSDVVEWSTSSGLKAARVEYGRGKTTLTIDERATPNFGAFVASRLDELHRQFLEEGGPNPGLGLQSRNPAALKPHHDEVVPQRRKAPETTFRKPISLVLATERITLPRIAVKVLETVGLSFDGEQIFFARMKAKASCSPISPERPSEGDR